jgi:hypothetical protein
MAPPSAARTALPHEGATGAPRAGTSQRPDPDDQRAHSTSRTAPGDFGSDITILHLSVTLLMC